MLRVYVIIQLESHGLQNSSFSFPVSQKVATDKSVKLPWQPCTAGVTSALPYTW